ncbi:RPM1-interacting protein 4-like isoform X2 [Silene latifolia]|uniref:RPM1-interacting protein 4-like isoform X2 n=1 Tax=Silene latifolia TaxID=37657 RepID=UPI003D77C86A
MARPNLPQFGNWDTEENISYTTYFENARRGSSSEKETQRGAEAVRTKHERKVSQEDVELRKHTDGGRRTSRDLNYQQSSGIGSNTPKRGVRPNGGSVRSADQSPLHPHYQAKIASKGSSMSSPSRERKTSEGTLSLAPLTPGRSRLRSVARGNETPERGTAVPKFGEWDETDPSSADGYSHIFSKVKEERHGSAGNAPGGATQTQHSNGQKRLKSKDSKGCCCFPWGGN